MFNLRKETIKKNIFFVLSIVFAFIFLAGVMCVIMGDASPIKFVLNNSPVKIIVLPAFGFFITFAFYKNSKKEVEENTK